MSCYKSSSKSESSGHADFPEGDNIDEEEGISNVIDKIEIKVQPKTGETKRLYLRQ